ncbi:MAG TPA: methyltransferase domain-containing protein [Chloroflexota bacterium]|jgi:SAM-dependent methyltransferase
MLGALRRRGGFGSLATETDISVAYRLFLGREPDAAGLASYRTAVAGGLTLERLCASFLESDEYRSKRTAAAAGLPDYRGHWNHAALGDPMTAILAPSDGSRIDVEAFDGGGRRDASVFRRFVGLESVVLDVGCGMGRIERHLARHCKHIYAVDVSDVMIAKAREWCAGVPNVTFLVHNAARLDRLAAGPFDFAWSFLVLQHLEYEDAFLLLRALSTLLKPGARAFLQFPYLLSAFYGEGTIEQAIAGDRRPIRVRAYTPETVRFFVERAGLRIEHIAVGLDDIVNQNEIGVICQRPAQE